MTVHLIFKDGTKRTIDGVRMASNYSSPNPELVLHFVALKPQENISLRKIESVSVWLTLAEQSANKG